MAHVFACVDEAAPWGDWTSDPEKIMEVILASDMWLSVVLRLDQGRLPDTYSPKRTAIINERPPSRSLSSPPLWCRIYSLQLLQEKLHRVSYKSPMQDYQGFRGQAMWKQNVLNCS